MRPISIQELVGNTDIYLLDQIMKNRYHTGEKILDAGCGSGRNLSWFIKNEMEIYGIDKDASAINYLKAIFPEFKKDRFQAAAISALPFENNFFDYIISSAVLHFAESYSEFNNMMEEMVRVLKPYGSLFIRMASDIGIENKVTPIENGVYLIPDGSTRFLLTPTLLHSMLKENNLSFIEPLKTVNVDNVRCMSTLVLMKK